MTHMYFVKVLYLIAQLPRLFRLRHIQDRQ
jgi:hypothetical protein